MNGTHAWPEILIAVQDALRQAESEAARRERDPSMAPTANDRSDKLDKLAKGIESSLSARQIAQANGLDALESSVQETEVMMAESQSDLENWLQHATPCYLALVNSGEPAI
jgi:hypothetical protein